jgi:3-oxoacyl-[acyl-carrier protein] reductase
MKVALVTGSATGVGRACAVRFAKLGYAVVVNYSKSEADARETVKLVEAEGASALLCKATVADDSQVKALVARTAEAFGRLDVLVNNAGILRQGLIGMTSTDQMRELLDVNVLAVMTLTQYATRVMDQRRFPSVVNLASIAGTQGMEGVTAYSASKAAVVGYTLSSAKELAPKGIRVNAIAPGFIDTDMVRGVTPDWYERRLQSIRMGRIGTPEDVAGVAVFLASDLSRYVTGQVIGVDGSMMS